MNLEKLNTPQEKQEDDPVQLVQVSELPGPRIHKSRCLRAGRGREAVKSFSASFAEPSLARLPLWKPGCQRKFIFPLI